jgi:adenylate cyclase
VGLDKNTTEFLDIYQAARHAYVQRDFAQAIHLLERAQQMRPTDQPIEIHLDRAYNYLNNHPPEDWDGIYTMTTK